MSRGPSRLSIRCALFALGGVVVACGHGESPTSEPLDTQPIVLNFCTSGEPDAPGLPNSNCLANRIALDEDGSSLSFLVRTTVQLEDLVFRAGSSGLLARHPQILVVESDGSQVVDAYANTEFSLGPGESIALPDATLDGLGTTTRIAFRFDELSPTR